MAAGRPQVVERLCAATAARLPASVARPGYDAGATGTGILHLGVGAFMRAHMAVYTEDAMAAEGGDWRIAGVSLRSGEVRDRLAPQDCLYTLNVQDGSREERRLVAALSAMQVAPEDPPGVVSRLADPDIRIVTLTVTEKGYCLDPGTGELDFDHEAIRGDLAEPDRPASTIGFLAAGLAARKKAGGRALTIVSCDNLPGNGRRLGAAVEAFVRERDPGLAGWMADHAAFPETMIDRIVPATTDEDLQAGRNALGLEDAALVKTEPFRQWVLEDRFAGERPAWEAGGALVVPEVEPYESAKLRLLNGAHSTLAYLGYLAGHRYVHEVVADGAFRTYLERLMRREISPVTPEPAGMEHDTYINELLERFENPALGHRTWQIAMDGSQKLPQRLLKTIELRLDGDEPVDGLCLAVAGWMRYVLGTDDDGRNIDVSDPLAGRFADIAARGAGDPAALVGAFLGIGEVFGQRLPAETRFRRTLERQYAALAEHGAAAAVRRFLAAEGGDDED